MAVIVTGAGRNPDALPKRPTDRPTVSIPGQQLGGLFSLSRVSFALSPSLSPSDVIPATLAPIGASKKNEIKNQTCCILLRRSLNQPVSPALVGLWSGCGQVWSGVGNMLFVFHALSTRPLAVSTVCP